MTATKAYYNYIKPILPRTTQLVLRRQLISLKRSFYQNVWPIDPESAKKPIGWDGWLHQQQFAFVLTHDVDTSLGRDRVIDLMKVEKEMGFQSSFNFVPEKYDVSKDLRNTLEENGFEVGVHGLLHDGKLYTSKKIFSERAEKINQYLKDWGAVGFRSPAMHHNLDWQHELNILYDASTFDTDPFEPQSDAAQTIYPFWVYNSATQNGYVELPYTLPQDFTLFVMMEEKDISIWKKKIDWLAFRGGMVLINTHPDYMNFDGNPSLEEYSVDVYRELLDYIRTKFEGHYWHVLPKDLALFWSKYYANPQSICEPAMADVF